MGPSTLQHVPAGGAAAAFSTRSARAASVLRSPPHACCGPAPTLASSGSLGLADRGVRRARTGRFCRRRQKLFALAIAAKIAAVASRGVAPAARSARRLGAGAPLLCAPRQGAHSFGRLAGHYWGSCSGGRSGHRPLTPSSARAVVLRRPSPPQPPIRGELARSAR